MACPSLLSLAARRAGRTLLALALAAAPLLAVAQTACPEIKVSVSPAGPLTLCPGGSVTLTATAVLAGFVTGPGFDADVYAIKRLGSGKVLVGGSFTTHRGTAAGRFVRLNADGSPDTGYRTGTGFNGAVRAVLPLRDGKVLVGGDFTAYDGTAGVHYLARLNRDGTLDTSFRPGSGLGVAPGNGVHALLGLDNGRVLVGGQFVSYDGTTGLGNIVLLAATGRRDATFVVTAGGFDAPVRALLDAGGGGNLALVGGDFTRYRGVAVGRLARLSPTAAIDPTFPTTVGFNAPVLALAYNNGVMVGGRFTAYNGRPAPRIARLDAAGVVDATFNAGAGFDGPVRAIANGNNGPGLLVGGSFTTYNGGAFGSHGLLRLNANGSHDFAFNTGAAGFDAGVYALEYSYANYGTQTVLLGGAFTAYNGTANLGRIVRLHADAAINNADVPVPAGFTYAWTNGTNGAGVGNGNTFAATEPGFYGALAFDGPNTCFGRSIQVAVNPPLGEVQVTRTGSGAALCAGSSATLTATATTVGAGFDGTVNALARQPDGKILVGGYFDSYNGVRVPHGLVRLNADYSLDAAFNAPRPGEVNSGFGEHVERLVLQPDGKILVGSSNLGSYNDNPGLTANLIRLNADGTPDPGFNTLDANGVPSGGGSYGLALLPSGKMLVGGYGTLQRLNPDGSLDPTFNPGGSGIGRTPTSAGSNPVISSIAVQPDDRIVVNGAFEEYNGNAAAPNNLMRLLANGTLDPSFNPGGAGPDQYQAALVLQPDGKILSGSGTTRTTTYNGNAAAPDNLMRVNADGSLDAGFNAGGSGFDAGQLYLTLQPDGKILVGNGYGYNGTQNLPWNIQRLNANGSFDTTFNPTSRGANDGVYAMLPLPGGQLLVGGAFTRYNGDALAPDHFLRLAADGSFANPAVPLPGATYAWHDGRTGPTRTTTRPGTFQVEATVNGCTRRSAAFALPASPLTFVRTTPSGAVSLPAGGSVRITANVVRPPFVPTGSAPASWVNAVAVLPDGKILAGGRFTTTVDGNDRRYVARYDGAGNLDFTFGSATPALDGPVNGVLPLPDEQVLVWGEFQNYASSAAPGIARLGTNGGLDNTFAPTGTGLNGAVDCAVRLFDGRILVGGRFTSYNGTARPYLARLNADGTLDNTFAQSGTGLNGAVTALALQADGQVLVGGLFTRYNGISRPHLLRLNPNGSLDPSFFVGTGLSGGLVTNVTELLVQPDGGIVVAGQFTTYFSTPHAHLLRLDASGNFDNSFLQTGTGFDGPLNAAALQPDGKIVVGGLFGNYNGVPRAAVARLNADGTLDASFTTTGSGFNGQLNALALQADGQMVAGGLFTSYNGSPRNYLARLNPNGSLNNADTPVAGATVAWTPGNSAANPLVASAAGSYVATATLPDGCTATAAAVLVSRGLGTAPAQAAALALWPNPARTAATLRLPATAHARTVLVADALGRVVRQLPLPAQAAALALDLSGLPAGVYVVRCGAAAARLVVAE